MLKTGLTHTSSLVVNKSHTALHVGSGDLEVLATPIMMSLMENAAMLAVKDHISSNETTVGGHIESSHLRPTSVNSTINATATLTEIEGKKLHFDIEAKQGNEVIGKGTHLRFIVNREKFMSNMNK